MKLRFLPAILGVGLGALSWTEWAQTRPQPKMIPVINGYTSWREVTQKPVEMDRVVSMLCAPAQFLPQKTPQPIRGTQGPHAKKYIRVFVNDIAEEQMTTRKNPHFPVESVIVKQKLPLLKGKGKSQKISSKPELLTVMIKREAGYDEANGDWQYMVTDGPGKQESAHGQVEACQGCHRPYAKTDYVVRSYLPKEVLKALQETEAASAPAQNEPENPNEAKERGEVQ